jgi:hypothetical protein
MVVKGGYVPKNNGTIFSSNGITHNTYSQDLSNNREGRYVTKRIADRYIRTPTSYLPDIPIPNFPDDVKTYIDKMRKEEKLTNLAKMSNDILYKCETVFPFDFFPDTLIIDKTKVNFIIKQFFFTETVHSIMIKNIQDIQVETSVLFAKLTVIPDVYLGQVITITYLNKSHAQEARRIIQGLMLCCKEGVDISDLDASEIKSKIETAGTAIEVKYAG